MRRFRSAWALASLSLLLPAISAAQQKPTEPGWPQPVEDRRLFGFALLDQNELRAGDGESAYRWDAQAWYGGNLNRLWLRTEGSVYTSSGEVAQAEAQGLYSRAITAFFNLQAGVRYDFEPSRPWLAGGVEGLAPFFLEVGAFVFASTEGRYAARLQASFDVFVTQRLVLQPQAEADLYARSEPGLGRGHSDLDAGLRLRYELRRELAPYVGYVHQSGVGGRFTAGLRLWH